MTYLFLNLFLHDAPYVVKQVLSRLKGVLQSKKWISQNYTRRVVYLYTSYFG